MTTATMQTPTENETYDLRYNSKFHGYLLVSCTFGHPVRSISTRRDFGGSANEADLAFDRIRCRECESTGRHIAH